jgi:aspartyl-tRNA(Asn)/glutamyl-tRNA(Gln) amidotransferase subunit A
MLHNLTLGELAGQLSAGRISSVEVTRHFLARIERLNPGLNAVITVTAAAALESAAAADRRRAAGESGSLLGIPLIHKDIFCTEGVRTSCGSRMLDNFIAPYDAAVVERLKAAGAVMLGKANMDEFAMGSSNETSFYGPVKNPWDPTKVPGGSSGGSAAAMAASLASFTTGTDTGGSIRQPAALTGVTGLKPTYGRVSRYGMIAYASSLDQAGIFARSAADAAVVLEVIAGFDPRDSTSVDVPVPDYAALLAPPVAGLPLAGVKIGLLREFFDGLEARNAALIEDALRVFTSLGASTVEVSLPHLPLSVPAYYVVAAAEASSNLSRFDGVRFGYRCEQPKDLTDLYERSRGEGFGTEVKRRIMTGTYVLSAGYFDAYYLKAQRVRRLITDDFRAAFAEVDLVIGPTTPTPAFALGGTVDDPVTMYLNDIYTVSANLAGLPGMSLPCGFIDGLPVGVQLLGPHFSEGKLLATAHRYQQATDWHTHVPRGYE